MDANNTAKNTSIFALKSCASAKDLDLLTCIQSTSSIDSPPTASSSTTDPSSTEDVKHNIGNIKYLLANALISVLTQNNSSAPSLEFSTFECSQQQAQTTAMEMDELETEIDEDSEVVSNRRLKAMDLQEDNSYVITDAEPDLLEQSRLAMLLKPRKKERHYMSIADDILRDLDEDDEC